MTKHEFCKLLKISSHRILGDNELTIEKALELMNLALSSLMDPEESHVVGSTVLFFNEWTIVTRSEAGMISVVGLDARDEEFCEARYDKSTLSQLQKNGILDKVFDPAAVAELHRLQEVEVQSRLKENENRDRAEYERLRKKFESML